MLQLKNKQINKNKAREEKKQVAQMVSYQNQFTDLKQRCLTEARWPGSRSSAEAGNVFIWDSHLWGGCLSKQSLTQALALQEREDLSFFSLQVSNSVMPTLMAQTGEWLIHHSSWILLECLPPCKHSVKSGVCGPVGTDSSTPGLNASRHFHLLVS